MLMTKEFAVFNLENAMRGARNPMNSWGKGDSDYNADGFYMLGENDLNLAQKLCRAGHDHRKFMRQIFVSVDIEAPLYWWKEFDTYKVGTVANSTSTMHKIHSKPFEKSDFSHDQMDGATEQCLGDMILFLEAQRKFFVETKDKQYWWNMIQLLPSSYNQMRTCTMSYENLVNMYHARKNHKLDEWLVFCDWIKTLPYATELICGR